MMKLKKDFEVFHWLEYRVGPKSKFGPKPKYCKYINDNLIKEIYHFSSPQIHKELEEIKKVIDKWVGIPNQT